MEQNFARAGATAFPIRGQGGIWREARRFAGLGAEHVLATARRRWRIAFAFGLVHGFGSASALRELHLPRSALAARSAMNRIDSPPSRVRAALRSRRAPSGPKGLPARDAD